MPVSGGGGMRSSDMGALFYFGVRRGRTLIVERRQAERQLKRWLTLNPATHTKPLAGALRAAGAQSSLGFRRGRLATFPIMTL